jgi:hypothetical protein
MAGLSRRHLKPQEVQQLNVCRFKLWVECCWRAGQTGQHVLLQGHSQGELHQAEAQPRRWHGILRPLLLRQQCVYGAQAQHTQLLHATLVPSRGRKAAARLCCTCRLLLLLPRLARLSQCKPPSGLGDPRLLRGAGGGEHGLQLLPVGL